MVIFHFYSFIFACQSPGRSPISFFVLEARRVAQGFLFYILPILYHELRNALQGMALEINIFRFDQRHN